MSHTITIDNTAGLFNNFIPPYIRLRKVGTSPATEPSKMIDNVRINVKSGLPRLHHLPEFRKVKGKDKPIVLVGGGPSLRNKEVLDELIEYSKFAPTLACGSSYDFMVEHGIIPTFCAICDPDPIVINYITKKHKDTIFLIATCCDTKVIEYLKDHKVYLWHCHSDEYAKELIETEKEQYNAIGGGCTIGLRSLSICIMLGYSNQHLFGFDSCLEEGHHHAYNFSDESEAIGEIYEMRVGKDKPGRKIYKCAGYQVAQAHQFIDYYRAYHSIFTPTFHGGGLLSETYDNLSEEISEFLAKKERACLTV